MYILREQSSVTSSASLITILSSSLTDHGTDRWKEEQVNWAIVASLDNRLIVWVDDRDLLIEWAMGWFLIDRSIDLEILFIYSVINRFFQSLCSHIRSYFNVAIYSIVWKAKKVWLGNLNDAQEAYSTSFGHCSSEKPKTWKCRFSGTRQWRENRTSEVQH